MATEDLTNGATLEEDVEEESDEDVPPPPEFFKKHARGSVSAEAYGDWNTKTAFTPPVIPKTDEQKERLTACLLTSFLFANLDERDLATVVAAMKEAPSEPKQRIIMQGDDGECLYVVESGQLNCIIKTSEGEEKVVKTCGTGDVFGELALLYNCPRAATVESVDHCVCWKLDRGTFKHIVHDRAQQKRAMYEDFLTKVPLLQTVDAYGRSQIADALRSDSFVDGQVVVTQGEMGDRFYIVEEGEAIATKDGEEAMKYVTGDYFGELALLRNQPRATTVTSKGVLKVLSIDSRTFKSLLNIQALEERAAAMYT
jgi:cAMP-dependent protein kinase regulator|eukprot:TRINITY_DN69715_c0_g1_i1.p1 TRINITY_DN69715_c0_g1~~TRINITY_DN69715_c0_g1_i1.p1  ORF type:complete len:335 (+),score=75.98 TRINITY_DN69715_c0_g1_i1:69-1007(+)